MKPKAKKIHWTPTEAFLLRHPCAMCGSKTRVHVAPCPHAPKGTLLEGSPFAQTKDTNPKDQAARNTEEDLADSCYQDPLRKDTNPKDQAATTRLDLSLFPSAAVAYGALAMTEGHLKYGGFNYRAAGVQVSVYVAACGRHLAKFYNGEDLDPVTKVPHLANALACLAVVIDSIEQGNVNDDRPPKQDVGGLLSRLEGNVKHLQGLFTSPPGRYREKK